MTRVPAPARQWVKELLKGPEEGADGSLDRLPLSLGQQLTRGQAEDLLVRLRRLDVEAAIGRRQDA